MERKEHWENVYRTKQLNEVSWYQPNPATSLGFIEDIAIAKDANIIDIGGGDSYFADHLLDRGYKNITVLDISATAIERAKQRLGDRAAEVNWIISDVTEFKPEVEYDFWHDRAAFHFLTEEKDIAAYVEAVHLGTTSNAVMAIGTFSEQGPKKCSGIEVRQYSETAMTSLFRERFEKIHCFTEKHKTPFETEQDFIFCSFRKKS